MRVLVTGATGQVGSAIVQALVERGEQVSALARDPGKAAGRLAPGVAAVRGDVTDPGTLRVALAGCDIVFNAVGLPEQWRADEAEFERVNALGTEAVVRAASEAGVRRVVHTSTIDVFDAPAGGRFDESNLANKPKGTPYERSKQRAEELALGARGDTELVFVNPAAVYGGLRSRSPSLERNLLEPALRKRLPALPPGGFGVAFARGVGEAHLRAAEHGRDGERYIVCDRHVSVRELVETAVAVAGRGRVPPTLPVPLAKALAEAGEWLARLTGVAPPLPRGQLYFFLWDAAPDSTKAQEELGFEPTPLEDGLRATLRGG